MLAFVIPVGLSVSFNTISFVSILRSLMKSDSAITSTKKTSGVEQARRGAVISVYLGLAWISGLLAIRDAKLSFRYLFCIFNSMQGFLIFLFYCVFSTEVRSKYRSRFFNKAPSNLPSEEPNSMASESEILEMKQQTTAAQAGTSNLCRNNIFASPVLINAMENAYIYGGPSN